MIAKHIPMRCASLSSFSGLVDYLTDTQNKEERVEAVNITNCISDTPDMAAIEVRATQMRNTRARSDKTWHMLISFRTGKYCYRFCLRHRTCAFMRHNDYA